LLRQFTSPAVGQNNISDEHVTRRGERSKHLHCLARIVGGQHAKTRRAQSLTSRLSNELVILNQKNSRERLMMPLLPDAEPLFLLSL